MLPKEGSQHACVGVWVCVGVQGGVKAKAEEGKINQILQEYGVTAIPTATCSYSSNTGHKAGLKTGTLSSIEKQIYLRRL